MWISKTCRTTSIHPWSFLHDFPSPDICQPARYADLCRTGRWARRRNRAAVTPQIGRVTDDVVGNMVLEIGSLTFMDSTGIALLFALPTNLASRGLTLTIFGPSRMKRRMLQITALDGEFNIEPGEKMGTTTRAKRRARTTRSFRPISALHPMTTPDGPR
jgi:anti-anti-sigma factor